MVKVTGPITKETHQFDVRGLLSDVDYVFVVEVVEKSTKKQSGPTAFRTKASVNANLWFDLKTYL